MNLMQSGLWGIGYVIVEMRTRKLIKRLVATPMRQSRLPARASCSCALLFLLVELPRPARRSARLAFGVPRPRLAALLLGAVGVARRAGVRGPRPARRRARPDTQTVTGLINLVTLPMFIVSGVVLLVARFPDASAGHPGAAADRPQRRACAR